MNDAPEESRRLFTRAQAADYCNVSKQTFSRWVSKGIVPPAIANTMRWDKRAIDRCLDMVSRSGQDNVFSPFDEWKLKQNARPTKGNSPSKE